MRRAVTLALFAVLTALAVAQHAAQTTADKPTDLFSTAKEGNSLSMFASVAQFGGLEMILRGKGPLTVYAPSNRAFANLHKDDLEALLGSGPAMHFLLMHYLVSGSITTNDTASLQSAKTMMGGKLRVDIRSEGAYVNGAKLSQNEIRCTNGIIQPIDLLDPGLVHEAVAIAKAARRQK